MNSFFSSILYFCMVTVSFCNATLNDQELFLQANNVYKKMEYQQARQLYNQIENQGYGVWINLGNCAYHLQEYPQAYVCWLRAQHDAPFSVQSIIENNYQLLAEKCGEKALSQSLSHQITSRVSPILIQLPAAFFWILFWLFVITGRWKEQMLLWSIIGMLALVFGILTFVCYRTNARTYAVTSSKVVVYSGPNQQYHAIGEVNQLCKVQLNQAHENWYKIRYGTTVGWILNRDIVCV